MPRTRARQFGCRFPRLWQLRHSNKPCKTTCSVAIVVGSPSDPLARTAELLRRGTATCVVLAGTSPTLQDTIHAIRLGITDIVDDWSDATNFAGRIADIARLAELRARIELLRDTNPVATQFPHIVGESTTILELRRILDKVLVADSTVLITGESGTGKSLIAWTIHEGSSRRQGPFIEVDCRRTSDCNDLFGCVGGATTGNVAQPGGLLARSRGGRLFLKEVAELPPEGQIRVLQERIVRTLGSSEESAFEPRIIASSTRDLEAEVAQGRMRADFSFDST